MDSVNRSTLTPTKNKLARTFTTVLLKSQKTKIKHDKPIMDIHQTKVLSDEDEKLRRTATMDAFVAKLFATISSVKAAYVQLQYAQSPYDAEGIQSADQIMVSELKKLSEFKQSFLKKQLDDEHPEETQLSVEIQEQKNLLRMYELTAKKLDSQSKLKHSEIIFLKERLNEANGENKLIERRLNSSGPLLPQEKLDFSSLSTKNFLLVLRQTMKSVRSFVKLMICEMESANWDLDAAASSIQPGVVCCDNMHKRYAFESFVCREMFDGFSSPCFSIDSRNGRRQQKQFFFDGFMELEALKPMEYFTWKPKSMFSKFCLFKYLKLVHPKMELSFFGNLNQRNLVAAGKFPETTFFASFADVAKRVWLLHCLAFAFDSKASAFQVGKGSRFTEVFMESVNEPSLESLPEVVFTVVPGFKVGKSVIQCEVYLS